jgi:hypothetical protein
MSDTGEKWKLAGWAHQLFVDLNKTYDSVNRGVCLLQTFLFNVILYPRNNTWNSYIGISTFDYPGLTQPLTEKSTRNLPGGEWWPAREADVTVNCGDRIIDVLQSCGPPRPIKGISFNWFFMTPLIATKFNTLTPYNFLLYSLRVSAPTAHPQGRYTISYYFSSWGDTNTPNKKVFIPLNILIFYI